MRSLCAHSLGILLLLIGCTAPAPETNREYSASRIVTLAPHLAELVYAAGAGERLVGVSAHTDYPPALRRLPHIGDAFRVDMERLASLEPDLVLAWAEGTPGALVDQLERRGYDVVEISTRSVADVAAALRLIGRRLGTETQAEAAADEFDRALDALVEARPDVASLRVFYQVSAQPLYTISGAHYISELITLCGGQNIFRELDDLAAVVTVESVLSRDPELILASAEDAEVLAFWDEWQSISAVRANNLRLLAPDTLARPTPRLLQGAVDICEAIDRSRLSLRRGDSP